jgi:hypothetical protein
MKCLHVNPRRQESYLKTLAYCETVSEVLPNNQGNFTGLEMERGLKKW